MRVNREKTFITNYMKITKLGIELVKTLRVLRACLENTCAGMILATNGTRFPSYRRKPVFIPSRPWMPACAGMTNQGKHHELLGWLQFHTL